MITEKKTRPGRYVGLVAGLILLILFLAAPTDTAESAKHGAELCFSTLVPSLFPFMVASGLITGSGAGTVLGKIFSPAMKLFGLPGECATPLVTGILCGFPVGAVTLSDLYRRGTISSDDGACLLAFCCYPSVPFLISAVGCGLFGSRSAGIILAVSVFSAGLLYGAAYGLIRRFFRKDTPLTAPVLPHGSPLKPTGNIFTEAVANAAGGMISVCACVIFFSALTGVLCRLGEAAGLTDASLTFLKIFFELTSGSSAAADLGTPAGLILCAAAAGWSGMSVHFQIMSTVPPRISLRPYFFAKAVQAPLAALICRGITYFFPPELISLPGSAAVFGLFPSAPTSDAVLWIAFGFFILSALILVRKKLDRSYRI